MLRFRTGEKNRSKLVEESIENLNSPEEQKESVVDRISARMKGKIRIPIPQDYKEFIREEMFKDLQAKQ